MKGTVFIMMALLAVLAFSSSALAIGDGKALMYGGAGQGKVIFDGKVHASKGMVCTDCHMTIFQTKKKALITMDDHGADKACFVCHNGKKAFNDCDQCHRKF
ncbi:MAG: hypothetical protein GX423_13555 [Nitrospiraceae bacterium]|nr:hypothetical protein [Nitrospiraceae bacterium]